MFFQVPRIRLKYFLNICYTWITSIVTLTTVTTAAVTNMTLICSNSSTITSPGYPSSPYPNSILEEWYISAPRHRRIVVTFNDFSVEPPDNMQMYTDVDRKQYTGYTLFPPYLTTGHILHIHFYTSPSDRRKGFNISFSCLERPSKKGFLSARLIGGIEPSEGFLELSTPSDVWMRVCEESFTERVAEVICGELGYPGVKDINYVNVNTQNCTRAPSCGDDTYRLLDCTAGNSSSESDKVVEIKCHEPGYKGCYVTNPSQISPSFEFVSAAHCLHECKTHERQPTVLLNKTRCFCATSDEVDLGVLTKCTDHPSPFSFSVYDASVGFCEELNDTIGGSWDSNMTWFGSIVHLTCMDGYTLKGNGTIQCVPGVTPYYPIWNDSIPECELRGSTALPDGDSSTSTNPISDLTTENVPQLPLTTVSDDCTYILLPVLIGSTVVLFLILLAVAIGWVIPQIWKYCSSNSKIIHTNLALQDRTPTHHVNLPVTSTISGASAVALINTTSPGKVGDDHNSIIYETIPSSNVDNGGYFSDSDVDAFGYVLPNPPKILKDETFMHEKEMIRGKSKTIDMLEDEKGYLVPNVHKVCK